MTNDPKRTVPADNPSPAPRSQRDWPMVLLAALNGLAIALVLSLIVAQPSPKPLIQGTPDFMLLPTPGPYLDYYSQGSLVGVMDPGVGQIGIIEWRQSDDSEAYRALDLEKEAMLWSIAVPDVEAAFATSGYLVVQTTTELKVIRAQSGRTAETVKIEVGEKLVAAQAGVALTVRDGAYICARSLANAGTCLWQANAIYPDNPATIFGDGAWVNTGDGVLDLLTGQPAPFGSDVTYTADRTVYYLGPMRDRVFRYERGDIDSARPGSYLQMWNTQNNQAGGPVMRGDDVVSDTTGSIFVTTRVESTGLLELAAYSWGDGTQLWQTTLLGESFTGQLCGDALVGTTIGGSLYLDSANIIDLGSGKTILSDAGEVLAAGNRVAYLGGYYWRGPLTAYSCEQPGFKQLWTFNTSDAWGIAGHLLIFRYGAQVLHEPA